MTVATERRMSNKVEEIDDAALAGISGGMRWEDLRPSENVEDRRNYTPQQTRQIRPQYLPPPEVGPRTPGDLPSQAGLDDLEQLGRSMRRRR